MIRGIDHIELIVRDVEEFVSFFQKLGFELIARTKHHGDAAELKLPGENQTIFEIHQAGGEEVKAEHRLAGARAAPDEIRPAGQEPAVEHLVEAGDAGR